MRTFERKTARRSGFTLIEMLVVIVIIVILMGVVFRLTRGAMSRSENAKEQALVTKVRTLIEEFHAEYNIYPPVPIYRTHDGEERQPINFRGAYPDATESRGELRAYPVTWSYAKVRNDKNQLKDCYFIFGLFSFFVDRSWYGEVAVKVSAGGEAEVDNQWGDYNDTLSQIGGVGMITVSQKDKAFAHRVFPIVKDLCGTSKKKKVGSNKDETGPGIHQSYDTETGFCMGYSTHVYGQWADGIGYRASGDGQEPIYDEGLVYISKPPYTTYLLFSKGPDDDYDHDYPEDRTKPKNKDNIYGNLGDK